MLGIISNMLCEEVDQTSSTRLNVELVESGLRYVSDLVVLSRVKAASDLILIVLTSQPNILVMNSVKKVVRRKY